MPLYQRSYGDSLLTNVKTPSVLESVITITGDTTPTSPTHDIIAAKFSVNNNIGTDPGTENLVAYWKLDETSGDSGTIFVDSTGNGNDLDIVYGTVVMENAVVNNGLSSSTGSNYIERRGHASNNLSAALTTDSFSISVWVNINTESDWADLLTFFMNQDDYTDYIRIEHANDTATNTGIYFGLNEPGGGTNQAVSNGGELEYGTWYHVVATCNRDTDRLTLYIDGDTVAGPTHFVAGLYDYTSCEIIAFVYGSTTDDKIDEVRVYDKVLTRDEALFLYSNPPGTVDGAQNPVGTANVNPLEVSGGGIVFNELASAPTVGGPNKGILYLGEEGLYFVDQDGNNITAASYEGGSWFDVEGDSGIWHPGPVIIGDSRPAVGSAGINHMTMWTAVETHSSIQLGTPGTHASQQVRFTLGTKVDSGELMGSVPGTKGWEIAGRGDNYTSYPNNLHFGYYEGDTTVPFWTNVLELLPTGSIGMNTLTPNTIASWTSGVQVFNVYEGTADARVAIQGTTGAKIDLVDLGGGSNDKWLELSVDAGVGKFYSIQDSGASAVQDNILVMDLGSGNVGIGSEVPDKWLSFKNNYFGIASDNVFNFAVVSNAYHNGSNWKTSTTGYTSDAGALFINGDGFTFSIYTGSAADETITWDDVLRIGSNGHVGFNTLSPDTVVDITAAGVQGLLLNQDTSDASASSRQFFTNSTTTFSQLASGGSFLFNHSATIGSTSGINAMRYNTSGQVTIGNANPHANSKLTIYGNQSHATLGPHLQFVTNQDSYPNIGIFSWSHDNAALMWDSYYTGTWKSSDVGSNFIIYKQSDLLKIMFDTGIAQGNDISWNNGIVLKASDGFIGFNEDSPDEHLHITDGNDPGIKLEKTGTGAGSGTMKYNSADESIDFIIE